MIRHVSILAVAFVALSTVPALAQSDTVTVENMQLHALTGLPQAPAALSDKELAAVQGQGITLANDHATPGGTFNNPGTSRAAGAPAPLGDGAIPSNVFLTIVGGQWFGRAAGK
jgi:hypothetical protein